MLSVNNISVKQKLWERELVNSRLELNVKGKNIIQFY